MTKKDTISTGLSEIGACWAVRKDRYTDPGDPYGAQVRGERTYHIHPDASRPYVSAMLRFRTLDQIAEYIKVRKQVAALYDGLDPLDDDAQNEAHMIAESIMADFWDSI